MKFPTNFDGSPILGGPCSITHSIIIMNCQAPKGFLKAPSSNPCFVRQFHSQTPPQIQPSVAAIDMAQKMCHPIAMLTYAEVVKLLPSCGRLSKQIISASNLQQPSLEKTYPSPPVNQRLAMLAKEVEIPARQTKNSHPPRNFSVINTRLSTPPGKMSAPRSPPIISSCPSINRTTPKFPSKSSSTRPFMPSKVAPNILVLKKTTIPTTSVSQSTSTPPKKLVTLPKEATKMIPSKCLWRCENQRATSPSVKNPSYTHFQSHKVPDNNLVNKEKTILSPPLNRTKWKYCKEKNFVPKKNRNQNKFWQKTPNILSSSWRTPLKVEPKVECLVEAVEMAAKPAEIVGQSEEAEEEFYRARRQSESSQTSEDSVVVFDRDSGCCYASEVSSCDSESDSDDDSTLSDSSVSSLSHLADSGLTSESEEEEVEGPILQVGDSARLSLPPLQPLPPASRLRSQSKSSLSDEDSDDDFIVFGSDSEEEESDEDSDDAGETVTDGMEKKKRTRMRPRVRFAETEEICLLYDDDDCRQARCGEWEEMARDRSRFKARIASAAEVLSPVLSSEHRQQVLEKITKRSDNCKPS